MRSRPLPAEDRQSNRHYVSKQRMHRPTGRRDLQSGQAILNAAKMLQQADIVPSVGFVEKPWSTVKVVASGSNHADRLS